MSLRRNFLRNLVPLKPSRCFSSESRKDFPYFDNGQNTRFNDNDVFGHMNNVIYYSFMDDTINAHLASHGILADVPRYVVSSSMQYISALAYPGKVDIGLRIEKLGKSSASYKVGLFASGNDTTAALGTFVHVYIDSSTGRPKAIPPEVRAVLSQLVLEEPVSKKPPPPPFFFFFFFFCLSAFYAHMHVYKSEWSQFALIPTV
jgi:acyl-CoA thioester hydrolase